MELYSYVLDHDYGFAPNPFYGICTLATCKPQIRERASVGDYILGTGCAKRGRRGRFVYMMKVNQFTKYDDYWMDGRFRRKRPLMSGSTARAFGDNIYHRGPDGEWLQESSFHSLPNGQPNPLNRDHDTHSDRVLISFDFIYCGGSGPMIPESFRNWGGVDICAGRAYKKNFPKEMKEAVVHWVRSLGTGRVGIPADWARLPSAAR